MEILDATPKLVWMEMRLILKATSEVTGGVFLGMAMEMMKKPTCSTTLVKWVRYAGADLMGLATMGEVEEMVTQMPSRYELGLFWRSICGT